jgi:hypothetical protein
MHIEIERWQVLGPWWAVRYKVDPPEEWEQLNLNEILGPRTEVIKLEKSLDNRPKVD